MTARLAAMAVAFALCSTVVLADDNAPAVAFHGWIDGYYAWNGNHPDGGRNWFEGVGTTARHADEPALNVVALEAARDPKPLGFHVVLGYGDSLDVVHAAEPEHERHPLKYLYQASVSYTAPIGRGVQFEAGIYPSHIGFEGFFTKDNWNYTRGWLGEFSPYYQSGLKTAYAWSDKWSAQVHVLRGWQNIGADVPAALGVQLAYNSARVSASFNTYNDRNRNFGDLVATWKATQKLSVGTSVDRGRQSPSDWFGGGLWGRYAFNDSSAIAFRAERYRDPSGVMSGTAQTLNGVTLTLEHHPLKHLIVKLEGRRDHSTAPVFANHNDQTLAIASAVVVY